MTDQTEKIDDIFWEALQIASPEQRAAYLDQKCSSNAEARELVEKLLRAQPKAERFLERPIELSPPTCALTDTEAAGKQIGPYKILQQIGEGGMGVVYLAEQTEPVQRRVALKIIKPGMDSRQVIARFEAERQALAMMDHPNIAKVFDAGTIRGEPGSVSPGSPYFVMELVRGISITKYCDDHHLTLKARLELFLPVCQAVQHAHQKGIIHRDLKPTNVLVAQYDDKAVPKVIDFGVAKAAQKLTDRTMFTEFGQVVGTLEYMSPEQARFNQLDIDTRSDIYSLGVLLYELLTGCTPFDGKHFRSAAFDEMLRIIREEDPPRPSTRLSTIDTLPSIAANRNMEPARLGRAIRGELDWIVMKALEKDRNRRYETTNGLAHDIERYLRDEPVQACPPSAGYRLWKFARRNKGPMLAATLVALALVGGVIGTTWGMFRTKLAETEAVREAGEKTVALGEKEAALTSAKAAQKDAQDNLKDALAAVDQLTRVAEDRLANVPQMEPVRRELLLDALKFYQKFLENQGDDPVIRREVALAHGRVGRIHSHFSQFQEAAESYRTATEMVDQLGAATLADPAFVQHMVNIHIEFSWVLGALGKGEEAAKTVRRAVELAKKLDAEEMAQESPAVDWVQAALATDQQDLASVILSQQRPREAEPILHNAVLIFERLATDFPNVPGFRQNLANANAEYAGLLKQLGQTGDAEKAYRRAMNVYEMLARDFPTTPTYRQTAFDLGLKLGRFLVEAGRVEEALDVYRQSIDLPEELLDDVLTKPNHWRSLVQTHIEFGRLLLAAGKKQEAEAAFGRPVSIQEKLEQDFASNPEHRRDLAESHAIAASALAEVGHHANADRLYGWALQHRLALVDEAPEAKESQEELASLYQSLGGHHLWKTRRLKDADRSYEAALEIFEKLALQFPEVLAYRVAAGGCRINLGIVAQREGEAQRAEQNLRQGIELTEKIAKERSGDENLRRRLGTGYRFLACVLADAGSPQEAETSFVRSLAVNEQLVAEAPKSDHYLFELGESCRALAEHWFRNGKAAEGRHLYQRVVEICEQMVTNNAAQASDVTWLKNSVSFLVTRSDGSPRAAQLAVELAKRAVAKQPDAASAYARLGWVYARSGQHEQAVAAYEKSIELDSKSARAYNDLAWLLATCPDANSRNSGKAVAYAQKAVELSPTVGSIWNTLGAAHYRAGNSTEAIAALEKSMDLRVGGDSTEWFFLAMVHWRLGEKKKARDWFDRAVKWMDEHQPKNEELLQFRAEAAELLSVEEKEN